MFLQHRLPFLERSPKIIYLNLRLNIDNSGIKRFPFSCNLLCPREVPARSSETHAHGSSVRVQTKEHSVDEHVELYIAVCGWSWGIDRSERVSTVHTRVSIPTYVDMI